MKSRDVLRALVRAGCTSRPGKGSHEMWFCPCGQRHMSVPTGHQQISPGIVAKLIRTLDCLPEGWLQ